MPTKNHCFSIIFLHFSLNILFCFVQPKTCLRSAALLAIKKTISVLQFIIDSDTAGDKDWAKIAERRGRGPLLRDNSIKILQNSTMFVFQWHKSRFTCFLCKAPFIDIQSLRDHTKAEHDGVEKCKIEKKIIAQQNKLLKVEISILKCKQCDGDFKTLSDFRLHLEEQHEVEFKECGDLLVPFKLESEGLKCQTCRESFTLFRLLSIHVNKHYQNHVCHVCGAGFTSLVLLNLHRTRSHRLIKCNECNLIFHNRKSKKIHDIDRHNVRFERKLRFLCPYCDERFFQENLKIQHLVDKHGVEKPQHRCNLCDKVFITRSLCNNHIKNVHKKEKKHVCDVCSKLFYTKSDVQRHRVTHTGEKKFTCLVCNNLFATRDSLKRHTKRTHVEN